MNAIANLMGSFIVVMMIVGAIVFMFSPKSGTEIFKRVGILLVILLVGVPFVTGLIRELVQSLWPWLLFFFLAASITAYLVRDGLAGKTRRVPGKPWGAERTPVLPNFAREEEDPNGDDALGRR